MYSLAAKGNKRMLRKIRDFFAAFMPERHISVVKKEVGGEKTLVSVDGYAPLDPKNIESGWRRSAMVDDYGCLILRWSLSSRMHTLEFTRVETSVLFELLFEARNDGLNKFGFHDSFDVPEEEGSDLDDLDTHPF
jgi:hypothetical protein